MNSDKTPLIGSVFCRNNPEAESCSQKPGLASGAGRRRSWSFWALVEREASKSRGESAVVGQGKTARVGKHHKKQKKGRGFSNKKGNSKICPQTSKENRRKPRGEGPRRLSENSRIGYTDWEWSTARLTEEGGNSAV